ncbi:FecR family protein [Dyadobacter sp. LHD-138]|uniref:FecR family protein n=1 Tax=Dyadobacter sp. LHD-138 TaxID=3071413 RepID=UPI0027DF59C4|nr:FecR family protein [Dyadobacter sp. LHD-138]MDQ6477057.1 FecR family protein [Dyadobacter sp. LHD-138]
MNTDYTNFGTIDLATDEAFLRHYLSSTSESEHFWNNWLLNNPGKIAEWEEARKLVEAVQLGLTDYTRTYLSKEAEEELLKRIRETNYLEEIRQAKVIPATIWKQSRLLAACIALAVIGLGYWLSLYSISGDSIYQQQTSELRNTLIEQVNSQKEPKLIYLPDSSEVLLFPASKMSYPTTYGNDNRNVYLTGKAVFDVRKNPERPFLVYANEIITKVLGTRFEVSAFEKDKDVVVKVQSGQVSVYQEKEYVNSPNPSSEKAGVLLMPNQQVIFKRTGEQFNKTLVEKPALLLTPTTDQFVYDETPVTQVLKNVGAAYGVDIVFSNELLQSCDLTANLAEEPLRGKLDIICRSIGATYEIVDAQIIITAKGCSNTKN